MIIDINASLGHYAFRRLPFKTAREMIALMDKSGIDRAVVSSLHSIFYRDAHRGNEELRDEVAAHGSRLIPVATVNPKYAGWERDLAQAVERWGMKIVTLLPEHHGYTLSDEHGRAVLARLAEYRVPLMLAQRLEDRRQRHHWDRAEDLQLNMLLEVARQHPNLKFMLVNWLGLNGPKMVEAGLKGRCLIDFARMDVVFVKDIPRLIASLGAEAIAFGSHMPFDYVAPSLVKLANIRLSLPSDYEKISWANAAQFLGLT